MDYSSQWSRILGIVLHLVALQWSVRADCDASDHSIIRQRASSLYDSILINDLEGYGFNGALLTGRQNAEEICDDYKNFKESIVNLLPRCIDDSIVKSLRVFLGYICFDGYTDFFKNYECIQRSFRNTQMLACSGLPTKYLGEINSRYTSKSDRLKASCKVARYTATCLSSNATVLCNSEKAGDVIFNVMKHSTENTYGDDVISCHVTEKDITKVNLDLSNVGDDGFNYGTTVRNPLSMEQKVPECSSGQGAATTYKLSEIVRCIKPIEHFVKSRWNFLDASKAIITRRDQTNLCRAYADFKLCIVTARTNCDLIESHLAGLIEHFDNFCNADYEHIQKFNGCSTSSRRATTRCLQPFMTYKAASDISVYENVSRLCKTLVESVDCVVDRTQIFIDTCPERASRFGVSLLMAYVATLNVTTQTTYYTVTKGICHARMPTWHLDQHTGKLTHSQNHYVTGGGDGGPRNTASVLFSSHTVIGLLMARLTYTVVQRIIS